MTARHYDTARQLNENTINARIWLGLHFRRAMIDGKQLARTSQRSCSATRSSRPAGATGTTGDPRPSRARRRELGFGA
jgi:hypothetical protein